VATVAALLGAGAEAAAPPRFQLGFSDPLFASPDATARDHWLRRAVDTGASLVRIDVSWSAVAPAVPAAGFDAARPGSPAYDWATIDAAVRAAAAHGLEVLFTVDSAPAWAEGPWRPAGAPPGTWKPRASAFGAFAEALARRYDGSFPDPLVPGSSLPRVRYYEAWNEPNLDAYLSPQWEGSRPRGAELYRRLLNRFYAGVKASQPGATVIAGSLAPFGDPPGGLRTPPVEFLRRLLCLRGGRMRPVRCPHPAHLDVLSDHPIAVGPPSRSAVSPLDATTPDLGRLTSVLRAAEANGRVLPRRRKPLWVTEFWYDSDPPDPAGVPLRRQARWYEQDLYMFWRQGASVAIALQLRDSPPGRGYRFTSQSGAFFLDGAPKPARTAFRFPFVAHRGVAGVRAWGVAPRRGRVEVQVRRGGLWATLAARSVPRAGCPFELVLPLRGRVRLRALIGGEASLPWALG
jgi:hypothetical protein